MWWILGGIILLIGIIAILTSMGASKLSQEREEMERRLGGGHF